jgi:hypothetical protein
VPELDLDVLDVGCRYDVVFSVVCTMQQLQLMLDKSRFAVDVDVTAQHSMQQ